MTIGDLAALPLAERTERILLLWKDDLGTALSLAQSQGLTLDWVSSDAPDRNLAWTVAWNLAPDPDASPDHPDQKCKIIHLGGDQGSDAPLADLRKRMTKQRPLRDPPEDTTCLCDLAWSIACERRSDWHIPDNARTSCTDSAFRHLWDRYDASIRNVLRSKYRSAPYLDIDACVNEAWARVYANYWLDSAQRRFLVLCPIKNFIITVSIYCAENERRKHQHRQQDDGGPRTPSSNGGWELLLHTTAHRRAVMKCLGGLPARQALYAYCRLLLGFQQNSIAALWRTSEANISQQLGEAWPRLRQCRDLGDALSIVEATSWDAYPETDALT